MNRRNSSQDRTFVYGVAAGYFIVLPIDRACTLARIRAALHASTWEQFVEWLPFDEWRDLEQSLHEEYEPNHFHEYCERILEIHPNISLAEATEKYRELLPLEDRPELPDDLFDPKMIPGYADGDWPSSAPQEMLGLIPQSIQAKYGCVEKTLLNGDLLHLDPKRESEIVAELQKLGFVLEKDEALVRIASGCGAECSEEEWHRVATLVVLQPELPFQKYVESMVRSRRQGCAVSRQKELENYDLSRMRICSNCFEIKGPWGYVQGSASSETEQVYMQKCRCEIRYQPDQEEAWPRFDFNICVELCKCCGAELLRSGSKWSVWFCEDCKEMVRQLHSEYQCYIIPIGRHSFHGGFGLDSSKAKDPAEIEYFRNRWATISEAIEQLDDFARLVVADILPKLGYENRRDITLGEYLERLRQTKVDKRTAFDRLCKFFEVDSNRVDK